MRSQGVAFIGMARKAGTAVLALLPLLFVDMAHGATLVEGGYGKTFSGESLVNHDQDTRLFSSFSQRISYSFTPRQPTGADPRRKSSSLIDRLSLELSIKPNWSQRYSFASQSGYTKPQYINHGLASQEISDSGMLVGGGLSIDRLTLMGGVGRMGVFGGTADVLTASMSYRGISASMSVGEASETVQGGSEDVMMFSTDLAVSSWLTIQGDVALGEAQPDDPTRAVGRLGINLKF